MRQMCLTDWDRDTMANFVQTTFSYALSSMKTSLRWLEFHWNLFLMAKWKFRVSEVFKGKTKNKLKRNSNQSAMVAM